MFMDFMFIYIKGTKMHSSVIIDSLDIKRFKAHSDGGFNIEDVKHMLALWRTNPPQLHRLGTIKDLE